MLANYPSDDLIYNRFDLIYDSAIVTSFTYEYDGLKYKIDAHQNGNCVLLNVWGKTLPKMIFEKVVVDVFNYFLDAFYIDVVRCGNNYNGWLYQSNNIYITIPKTIEELMTRLSKKHRYNLRRERKLLEQKVGTLSIKTISRNHITKDMVNEYFNWKKMTHGCEYNLSPAEYLDKYHVTNAMLLYSSSNFIGIVFFAKVNNTVYIENFSYNYSLRKYSIGAVLYWLFLESLISLKCKYCFLGGGRYEYKKHFGAIECVTYSGKIYSSRYIDRINIWLKSKGIYKVAIYGIGAVGEAFLIFAKKLDICVCYGIDKNSKKFKELSVYAPSDDIPCVDAVFITINSSYNEEIEIFMKKKKLTYYYWNDIDKYVP